MSADSFIETFREEALELLGTLESTLLELEEHPDDMELLSAVFRVMHTIKGSAAMFGLEKISHFAHEVESILTALREGRIAVSRDLIDRTLQSRDIILELLDEGTVGPAELSPELNTFLEEFRTSCGYSGEEKSETVIIKHTPAGSPAPKKPEGESHTWRIVFKPGPDVFARGANPLLILNELKELGDSVCIPIFDQVGGLTDFNPEECVTAFELFLTTTATENELRDVFIFVEDASEVIIEKLDDLVDERSGQPKKLGEILIERGKLSKDSLDKLLGSQRRIGEILVEEHLVSPGDLKLALEQQKQVQKVQKAKVQAAEQSTIRVKSEKLDDLMALVGELVTVHARILEMSRLLSGAEELVSVVEQFGRLTDELRSNTMSVRMVPIGTTFTNFKRLVRDLSAELGKSVDLVTEGGETELDKTVIEKLDDPLIHIIRNSLDHGLESPETRLARGKTERGTIRLSATQTGASVYISIEDDGNGLNRERIKAKAVEKGLIQAGDILSDAELFKLIFAPGFSTKDVATAVSGRGVGMDVVNRQMELINGTVIVESEEGRFTRITLKIPLTLAIIEGLLVRIDQEHFVIPLTMVVGCLEFIQQQQKNENNLVIFHDRQLPFVNLRSFFGIKTPRSEIEQIVVVAIKDQQIGLLVDQVIGGNQTVIKPLGKLYKRAEGVSSATIMGDGSVALILDVEKILENSEKKA